MTKKRLLFKWREKERKKEKKKQGEMGLGQRNNGVLDPETPALKKENETNKYSCRKTDFQDRHPSHQSCHEKERRDK